MGRKLSSDQAKELEQLRVACLAILEYFNPRGELGELADEFRAAVQGAYMRRDLRGLRSLRRDFQEWLRDLPTEARVELERSLALLNVPAPPSDLEVALARGRIETEDEYRAVLSRVEDIYDDPARESDITRLNALLSEYDLLTSS